jgi:hypothetical protein
MPFKESGGGVSDPKRGGCAYMLGLPSATPMVWGSGRLAIEPDDEGGVVP